MNTKTKTVSFFLFAAVLLSGCGSDDDGQEPVAEQQEVSVPSDDKKAETRGIGLTAEQQSAVERNNDFAFSFFRSTSQANDLQQQSYVLSPLSLTYVLGMLNAGATGQTSTELTQLLGFGLGEKQAVDELCRQLIEEVPKVDEQVALNIANMVAVDRSVSLKSPYSQVVSDYYHGTVAALPFGTKEAADYVNGWCSEQTAGQISKIVEDLDGRLALLNAVHFKAPWSGDFDAGDTREQDFTREDGTTRQIPVMHRRDVAYYSSGNGEVPYATLGLPYGNGKNWTMYVLLPYGGTTVSDVIGQLNMDTWKKVLRQMSVADVRAGQTVDVLLPRFTTASDLALNEALTAMGAQTMFSPKAEFPLMSDEGGLSIDLVKQKALIEVTEEGTEASAVTIARLVTVGDSAPSLPTFHATRPFVYLIQEETSGAIFFMGVYRGE